MVLEIAAECSGLFVCCFECVSLGAFTGVRVGVELRFTEPLLSGLVGVGVRFEASEDEELVFVGVVLRFEVPASVCVTC